MEQLLDFHMTDSHGFSARHNNEMLNCCWVKGVTHIIHIIRIFNLEWSIRHKSILSLHVGNLTKSWFL